MIISLIVACSQNGVIGSKGKIPWFVRGEQARFKTLTMGHPLIMGRKTHESIGRSLPGRLNVVISSNPNYESKEGSVVVGSLAAALELPEVKAADEVFVIGGEMLFAEALPIAKKLYLTKVHTLVEGDKFFQFKEDDWRLASSELFKKNEVPDRPFDFEVCVYERKA